MGYIILAAALYAAYRIMLPHLLYVFCPVLVKTATLEESNLTCCFNVTGTSIHYERHFRVRFISLKSTYKLWLLMTAYTRWFPTYTLRSIQTKLNEHPVIWEKYRK